MARSDRRRRGGNGRWRWVLALAVLLAVVAALVVADRKPSTPSQLLAPTTVGPTEGQAPVGPDVTETQLPVPSSMSGTLYVLGKDATLTEIDLPTGRTRSARLTFRVEPGPTTQVVPLRDVVLIGTRRQVFMVDRATLAEQNRLADERWIVGSPDGTWAALVPFGAAASDVIMLDGAGIADRQRTVRLPAGVTAVGAVSAGLVLDAAGTLQLRPRDGTTGPTLGTGRYVASGATALARLVCQQLTCTLHTGTTAQPDQVVLDGVNPAGSWELGAGGVFAPRGEALAMISVATTGSSGGAMARVVGLGQTPPAWRSSPVVAAEPATPPALAFTADGATLVHASSQGLVFWAVGSAPTTPGAGGGMNKADELPFATPVLALGVTAQPPPPPPPQSGPPPSFA